MRHGIATPPIRVAVSPVTSGRIGVRNNRGDGEMFFLRMAAVAALCMDPRGRGWLHIARSASDAHLPDVRETFAPVNDQCALKLRSDALDRNT